ncbi:MAG: hypothetical protein HOD63_17430 [Bacteroidetes bacterium]|nr:hypothetical protein [Bacteroidota bacterium]MBT4729580.1 hypothetical protein [Bacteroidota bacterium]
MDKKSLIPFGLIITGISFILISVLLLVFKSNRKLIAQKFKLGGIILTLTGSISSCKPVVMCYDPMPPADEMYLNYEHYNDDSGYYEFDLSNDSLLNGVIDNRQSDQYSFRLLNDKELLVQANDLQALDSSFDSYSEPFSIPVIDTLSHGFYDIQFYNRDKQNAQLNPDSFQRNYSILIKK